jgi:hypothetical protein
MSAAARCSRRSFFPEGHFTRVPPRTVQKHLRLVFAEWGRPATLRVDNGAPWGSWSDLPPVLALWIIGLGIDMHWNDPNCPEQNGVIERSQGLAQAWAEPGQCHSIRQFQNRIHREDRLQREQYRSIDGQPRMVAYPQLKHSGRRYSVTWEQRHWDWQRVLNHLAGYAVSRRVDQCGKLGMYSGKLYVGTIHKGHQVYVQLDPDRMEWIVSDLQGQQLRVVPATELTSHAIRTLNLKPAWRR